MSVFRIVNDSCNTIISDTISGTLVENASTNTPLDIAETYTSSVIRVSQYNVVSVAIKTDQNGILTIQFSTDGINWDQTETYTIYASIAEAYTIQIQRAYLRVTFENTGGSPETYLRLQTILGTGNPEEITINTDNIAKAGTVSSVNSSEIPLDNNETFTGSSIDVSGYNTVTVSVFVNLSGLLSLEFSSDNNNWDSITSYTITANTYTEYRVPVTSQYYRTVFLNNSGSNQTDFRLQTLLGSQQIEQDISLDTTGLARDGTVDSNNSTTTPLNNNTTFTGTGTDVSAYPSVVVACLTDQNGILYVDFSPNNTNWDSTLSFTLTANVNEVHRITVTRRYYRARVFNNSGANQTFLRFQTLLGSQTPLTSTITSSIQTDADTILTRSILTGIQDSGNYANVPVTAEGHLEVAIHAPLLPFGSLHVENILPIFQSDAVYGLDPNQVNSGASLSGSTTASDSNFIISTGVTIYSQAYIQSYKRLRYRAGQGVISRFTALYTTPANLSYQIAGIGHSEDGVYFGYVNTDFGVLYSSRGVRETRTLTVTVGATGSGNASVTLNDEVFSIPVTGASSTLRTSWELSRGSYPGWSAFSLDSTVIFVADSAGPKSGAYSLAVGTSTGTAGTFAQTKAGVSATEVFIPQDEWNGDPMDGTGPSGVVADWTKGNVFEIGLQYLGYGSIYFSIEISPANRNNSSWVIVHTLKLPNTRTLTTFRNPTFPFTTAVYSAGSTTNLTVKIGSFAGFIEGKKVLNGNRYSYYNQLGSVTTTAYQALFTVMNMVYFNGLANQAVINIISLSAALKSNNPCIIYIVRNGSLVGNPNFAQYASTSCSAFDNSATQVTFSSNNQLIWSGHLGDTGQIDHDFNNEMEEFTIQPGEWITVCARSIQTNPTWVTASLNTREDQ